MQITSESVKVGHPDIVSDSIASNIISRILEEETKIGMDINTMPHCGIEVFLGKGLCVVGGKYRQEFMSILKNGTSNSIKYWL